MFAAKNCCSCSDANSFVCDRGIMTEVSCKFVHGNKCFPSWCFVKSWPSEMYFVHFLGCFYTYLLPLFFFTKEKRLNRYFEGLCTFPLLMFGMIDNSGRFIDDAWTVIWLFPR
ncbi:unnamed protein product [Brassica rapa]|uniref:Uncharacterized protein n=1 Tax=Brassica campestris TaxID=3711 RepID=A0A8D9HG81_BRACM|nr:unnamed protein product [Brassica rapa]